VKLDKLEISPLDYGDFGRALLKLAELREKAALGLKPGIKRDNMMARGIRLKRQAEQLLELASS
jgi:hypothetical protein